MSSDLEFSFESIFKKLEGWMEVFISMLPNLILALVALVLFNILAKVLSKTLVKTLPKVSRNDAVIRLISSITSVVTIIIGLFIALSILNLDKTVTSLLAGVGIIGLALGFAFQNAAANVLSGVVMAVNSPINVGDIIESNGHFGEVNHIGLRATTMTNPWGQEVEIPNRLVLQEPFKHYTFRGKRRVDVQCHIGFDEDLDHVRNVVLEEVQKMEYLVKDESVDFFYTDVEDYAIVFEVRVWVPYAGYRVYFEGQSEAIERIHRALRNAGIKIPVPPRVLRFEGKGGFPSQEGGEQ